MCPDCGFSSGRHDNGCHGLENAGRIWFCVYCDKATRLAFENVCQACMLVHGAASACTVCNWSTAVDSPCVSEKCQGKGPVIARIPGLLPPPRHLLYPIPPPPMTPAAQAAYAAAVRGLASPINPILRTSPAKATYYKYQSQKWFGEEKNDCECGGWKVGYTRGHPGHSGWCPARSE